VTQLTDYDEMRMLLIRRRLGTGELPSDCLLRASIPITIVDMKTGTLARLERRGDQLRGRKLTTETPAPFAMSIASITSP
jgi:hypothetical protein